jgi:hypothetical protein
MMNGNIVNETLFSQIERNKTEPAGYSEPHYDYLDKSARIEMGRVREVLEAYYAKYPNPLKREFKRRCQTDDRKFLAAVFELYLHELLLRLGYSIEIEPQDSSSNRKRPDFRIHNSEGEEFYLEAVVASGASDKDAGQEAIKSRVYDAINSIESPNFFLGMEMEGAPNTEPPVRSWKQQLLQWLTSLNPDENAGFDKYEGVRKRHELTLTHDGWQVIFSAIPKSITARGEPGIRPIGTQMFGFRSINSAAIIRNAVMRKAKRYGKLEKPYIIAANVLNSNCDRIAIMEALFGTEQYVISPETFPSDFQPRVTIIREPDGIWTRPSGPRYTRVSAVLVTDSVRPWSIASRDLCLYHNPWASNPYDGQMRQFSEAIPTNNNMDWKDGIHPRHILELPEGWPE